jgi:hypothetical protein
MIEAQLKTTFIGDSFFHSQLEEITKSKFSIVPEVQFINGITADFALYNSEGQIISIVECKGDDIGVTEYVRGIGQITQYEYFKRNNINGNINKDCRVFLSFPSTLMQDSSFDISKFAYPVNTELLIVNSENKSPILINPSKEYNKIQRELNTLQLSPYYFRDTRIAELYIVLLEIVKRYKIYNHKKINRIDCGGILAKYNTVNKGNARNVFIALSSLGFIDSENVPTMKGLELVRYDFANFCSTIIFEYYKPLINAIFRGFDFIQKQKDTYNLKNISNIEIANIIRGFYSDKDIYYLTESNGRYISSWLNSLRDDVGCINFRPKQQTKEIIINYNPLYSKEYTTKFIRENVIIDYLNNYLSEY